MVDLHPLSRLLAQAPLALLLGAALSSCGGGVSIRIGDDVDDGRAPSVSLSVSSPTAQPGQSLRLSAAASDVNGIQQLIFYQSNRTGEFEELRRFVYQETDRTSVTQEIDTFAPSDGRPSVQYRVRATDFFDRSSDSEVRTVTLMPS